MSDTRIVTRRTVALAAVVVLTVAVLAAVAVAVGAQLFLDWTVGGLATGAIAAISGVGVVVTYKATGIFNFAHGAMAVLVAYVLWQLTQQWGVPVGIAAPIALLAVGPGLGVALERLVFRPLSRREASTAESLVATIGVFVVLLGVMSAIWGTGTKNDPVQLFPRSPICLGACGADARGLAVRFGLDQLGTVVVLLVTSAALYWLFARSRLGVDIKAVVDRRELAQLTSVDADRVSAISWALGAGFAGLSGVLLAPVATGSLDPFRLTLLVVETFAVAVLARLTSLPRAIAAGLGLGLAASYLTGFHFSYLVSWVHDGVGALVPGSLPDWSAFGSTLSEALDSIIPNITVFVLLGALLFMRRLDALGGGDDSGSFVARVSAAGGRMRLGSSNAVTVLIVSVVAVALPFGLQGDVSRMRDAHVMLALAIVFLSIVVVTGFSGHITLAQAGFAGVGALTAAKLYNAGVPVVLAMLVGGIVCIPIGLAAGYPALRRRGLFLGLTTLALALVLERGLLQNNFVVGNASAATLDAPVILGIDLGGGVAFYLYELAVLTVMVLLARNLRRSRLGRVLGAMRDSEAGARAVALNLRTYKLFIFCTGAFMAGVGGALLAQATGTYSPEDFVTIKSLLWFAVVVVAGVGSIYGALLGAFLLTLLGSFVGETGVSTLIVGLAAVSLGRLPGGLVGVVKRLASRGPSRLLERTPLPHGDGPARATQPRRLRPSAYAHERMAMVRDGVQR